MMYFYQPELTSNQHSLENEEFQHCTKVLRKKEGDIIGIMDGKGTIATASISVINKRSLTFEVSSQEKIAKKPFSIHIAIAPTKSIDRMEWFVEKAGELGVDEITFLLTKNSERPRLKLDRLEKKAISALKQSKSGFLTKVNPLISFTNFLKVELSSHSKSIATVGENPYFSENIASDQSQVVLIGPEGDFTKNETLLAIDRGFSPISLGKNALRTETAGIVAAQIINTINKR